MLVGELDQVRNLKRKIEAKKSQCSNYGFNGVGGAGGGSNRVGNLLTVNSEVSSVGPTSRGRAQELTGSVNDKDSHFLNLSNAGGHVDKEQKAPKINRKRNLGSVNRKEKMGSKSNKKLNQSSGRKKGGQKEVFGFGSGKDRYPKDMFKKCEELLGKLMKHQYGWVFNAPVDAKKLKLHDYHKIIKHPMDLGTVKSRLSRNCYTSPKEFADDVRLTFNNAMTYNEKGQDVHFMADTLLKTFEENWEAIRTHFQFDKKSAVRNDTSLPTPSSKRASTAPASAHVPAWTTTPVPPPLQRPIEALTSDRSDIDSLPVDSRSKTSKNINTATNQGTSPVSKKSVKKNMTFEEKQRLSLDLQSLPSDKLDSVVQIIRRRNPEIFQQEDEIEVDIESFDTETLQELDRFLTNYKNSLGKSNKTVGPTIPETNMKHTTKEAPTEPGRVEKVVTRSSPVNLSGSSSPSSSGDDSRSFSSEPDRDSTSGYRSDADQ
uniref:Malate dehydrogenase n=1 Tax=Rhizophora mucronata TaxID=61149 RepID=A0A2P2LTW2_RHIMU